MFRLTGINSTVCDGTPQGINKLSQAVKNNFEQLANGTGTILRFKLLGPLTAGGSASCEIHSYDGGGYSRQRTGVIHDEEPGGYWEGDVDDEGWCTGRDGQKDHYSVVFMPVSGRKWISRKIITTTYGSGDDNTLEWNSGYSDGSGLFQATSSTVTTVYAPGIYRHTLMVAGIRGTGAAGPDPTPAAGYVAAININGGPAAQAARASMWYGGETHLYQDVLQVLSGPTQLVTRLTHNSPYFTGMVVAGGNWTLELLSPL